MEEACNVLRVVRVVHVGKGRVHKSDQTTPHASAASINGTLPYRGLHLARIHPIIAPLIPATGDSVIGLDLRADRFLRVEGRGTLAARASR